jgi:hypothetical protein
MQNVMIDLGQGRSRANSFIMVHQEGFAMWLTLFALSFAAAILFSLAPVVLQQCPVSGITRQSGGSDLLLFRRMRLLGLDPVVVALAEPLSFWELELRCRTCNNKEHCACDLADNCRQGASIVRMV